MKNIIIASLVGVILTLICSVYVEKELNEQLQLILKTEQQKHYQDIKLLQKPRLISTISTQVAKYTAKENKTLKNEYWKVSTYYTPVKGQLSYFLGSYERDYRMNCSGDCLTTASGYRLSDNDRYKIVACPPSIPLGTKLKLEYETYSLNVRCEDRGGSIKGKRLDLYVGIGVSGRKYQDSVWIGRYSGLAKIEYISSGN